MPVEPRSLRYQLGRAVLDRLHARVLEEGRTVKTAAELRREARCWRWMGDPLLARLFTACAEDAEEAEARAEPV